MRAIMHLLSVFQYTNIVSNDRQTRVSRSFALQTRDAENGGQTRRPLKRSPCFSFATSLAYAFARRIELPDDGESTECVYWRGIVVRRSASSHTLHTQPPLRFPYGEAIECRVCVDAEKPTADTSTIFFKFPSKGEGGSKGGFPWSLPVPSRWSSHERFPCKPGCAAHNALPRPHG